jgi:hypothetical protein
MTYEAKITLKFDSTWDSKCGIYDDEMLPEQHITMEVPAEDLNTTQLFRLWESFLQSMGYNEFGIMKGAAHVAFNEMRSFEEMKKTAYEYDLVMIEDYNKKVSELEAEISDLKAKLSRQENPDNPQYTEEEMNAMTDQMQPWGDLIPGSKESVNLGCICPVMDNQEMPDNKKWVDAECPIHGRKKSD